MDKIFRKNLLYDFYGELLTEHQKRIYEDAVYGDYSLSELAEGYGISRQGIHDLLKRCDKILDEYEKKLGLVEKFGTIKSDAARIGELAEKLSGEEAEHINALARHIVDSL